MGTSTTSSTSVVDPVRIDRPGPVPRSRGWAAARRRLASLRLTVATPPGERQLLAVVIMVGLAVYALAARLRVLHGPPSGDEPAYLVLSQALYKYHSLDVMQVHNNNDYRAFYPGFLDPHVVPGANGDPEPLHQFGGPLLWLVPFAIWGRAGALGFMAVVSVLTLINIYYFMRERNIDPPYAFVVTLVMAIGSPIYVLSAMSFVEPIGTLAIIYAVRAILIKQLTPTRLVIASLGVAYAPWIHMRFAPTSLVLGLLLLWRVWRDTGRRSIWPYLQCLVPLALSVLLVEVFTMVVYGSVNPMAPQSIYGVSVFDVPFYKGLAGTLFDRNYGLIDHFPIFLFVLPGFLLALHRKYLRMNVVLMTVIIPYLLLSCTSTTWWGAYTPPARYISVVVPLLAVYIGVMLQRVDSWIATGSVVLLGGAAYGLAILSDIYPNDRFTGWDKRNDPMERIGDMIGIDFVKLAPSAFAPGQVKLFMGWTLATIAVGLVFWALGARSSLFARIRGSRANRAVADGGEDP